MNINVPWNLITEDHLIYYKYSGFYAVLSINLIFENLNKNALNFQGVSIT